MRSVRKGEGDYREKDLWKSEVLSLEWDRDGVMHSENCDDDDELVRER